MEHHALIERLARHLAAHQPENWVDRVEDAASILAILKEPDAVMAEAGCGDTWRSMIDAALRQRWQTARTGERPHEELPAGADEEGELPLSERAVGGDPADWIHLHKPRDK